MKRFFLLSLFCTLLCGFSAMAEDRTLTEDFEKQTAGTTYNSQQTYTAENSNAGIGWYVEHGTVSTTGVLTGSNSMHMRAYYAKSSAEGTWNGALPYVYSTTAVKGLKSVTFNAAVSNTGIKYDTYYSTDGSTWTAIQTAQSFSNTLTASKSFNIPNSDANTDYYIKIAASSSSTHTANPSKANNYTFRVDDIVFTYSVETGKTATTTSFSDDAYTAYIGGEAFTSPTATVTGGTSLAPSYSSSNTNVATVDATSGAVTLVAPGTATITASYAGDDTYEASSDTYTLTVGKVYANLAALVADGEPTTDGYPVKVTLSNEVIQSIYTTSQGNRNGVILTSGEQAVQLYKYDVPETWSQDGTISGTITGDWKLYYSTWEVVMSNDWSQLTYSDPKTITALAVSGTPTKTTYYVDDTFETAGLTVTATYSDETTGTITSGFEWTIDYGKTDGVSNNAFVAGANSVDVMVSIGDDIMSDVYTVTGLTINAAKTLSSVALSGTPTKTVYTVGEFFDPAGITVTANYSDGTNADVTSEATFYGVGEALAAGMTSFETYATYKNVDSDVTNYDITVNKKNATIIIANMELGLTDANVEITAETTPENAELTYSITEGNDYITLSNGTISAVAPGTATVKASFTGNDEYAAAEKSFTVTVSNQMIATKGSFTTGDNSGSHNFTNNTDLSFEAFQGNAGTAPAIPNNTTYLRLYQNGGYITISGVKGVKIQSITITTGSTYESTTVGYCVDDNDAPTTGATVANNTAYTISGLDNQKVKIYCLATDSKKRLDIASIEVKYTKVAVTLSSIAVSGEYETSFIKNAEFNHTGAVVKATFSDGDVQDVTSSAVFSEPDMTTTGEKTITISYTHEGVEKTTSYTINVEEEIVTDIALSGTYTKVFKTSDTFNHEGVVVTATYNSARTAVVEDAEFSTPDLTTTGTKTVTVTYAEKQATYDIKVIPANAIFFESFDGNDGTGGNDDKWSGSIAANDIKSDNADWTFASAKGAKQCAKFGTGSAAGSAKTPAITLTGAAKITFKAAAWDGNSEATTLNLSATSGTLSQSSVTMVKKAWTEYTVYLTGVEESTQITFAASQASNNRFFLDEVLVESVTTHSLKVTSHGWASICLPYAVQLPADNSVKAYYASAANNSTITLSDVTGVIPANTGVLVEAVGGTYNLNIVADVDALQGNLFVGTLVATTVEASSTYVLSTETTPNAVVFGKYTGTNMPANKAYIPASALGADAPGRISFVKEGTSITTGIDAIDANEEVAVKFIKDGVLYIKKNGVVYNAMGQIVR